jgi:TonB family protein
MLTEVSNLPVCIEKQRCREREALHRWLLYATCGSAIAHILLLGISIKQSTTLPVPQESLPDSIDLTLITTAATPAPPISSITDIDATEKNAETPPSTITAPVVAIKPAINHAPTLPKTRIENVPQLATPSVQPPDQTAKAETAVPFTQETPATSNLPEIANQGTMDGTDKPSDREQGTANSNAKPSSLNGFSDRIRHLLQGNSPNSNPSSINPTPNTDSAQRVQCIRCDKPQYPTEARNQGWKGQARLAVDVDANGNVTNVRLINSSGHLELDEAAIRQARQWKFTPSASGRQGIGAKVDFQLEGSEYQRQRQRERQTEELARQESPKPNPATEVVRQENPQPAKPTPAPEVARQEQPKPVTTIPVKPDSALPPPVVAQPEPVAPNPPADIAPQPIEDD